jgi:hypothetical protein
MIEIRYSDGSSATDPTLAGAIAQVQATYPEAVFIDQSGWEVVSADEDDEAALRTEHARLLVWATAAASEGDDGAHAVAALRWQP